MFNSLYFIHPALRPSLLHFFTKTSAPHASIAPVCYNTLPSPLQPQKCYLQISRYPCLSNSLVTNNSKILRVSTLSFPYTKHNSKVTGMVAKADKGSLRQPQKISTLPEKRQVVFFCLPLHLSHPSCGCIGIMFSCIFRCKLGSWWLLIYVYSSA